MRCLVDDALPISKHLPPWQSLCPCFTKKKKGAFKAVKPKYCKTKFGTISIPLYIYASMKSSLQGLSDDVLIYD